MSRSYRRTLSEPAAGSTPTERITAMSFAQRLGQILLERGMTQSDLARLTWGETLQKDGTAAAKGRDRVSDYINGKALPSPKLLQEMAAALGMTPEELAPDLAGATAARAQPAISMTVPASRPDLVHVQVDLLLPAELAPELMALLQRARKSQTERS